MRLGLGLGFRRRAAGGVAAPIITQTTPATFGPYVAGNTPADVYTAGTFASSAGTISGNVAQWTVNGVSALGSTVLAANDIVALSVLVTDSAANTRTFGYGTSTVPVTLTAPAQFGTGDWSVVDAATGGDIRITITTLPSNGGSAITALQYRVDAGSWVSLGGTATGVYEVAGLTDDVSVSITIRAVNAVGNGTASAGKSVTPTDTTVPDAFTVGQWTLTDSPSAGGNTLTINISALPFDGQSAITALEYRRNGGAASTLSGVGTGSRQITVLAETLANIEIRAVNNIGDGAWSDTKSATPTVSAGVDRDPEQFRYNALADHGSTGDVFVDADTGSDANPGTSGSPKATIAGGLAILSGGQTMKLRGTFRETMTLSSKGGSGVGSETKIEGWGTAKPIISAQDPLTGWTACTIADEAALSADVWPNCYYKTMTLTDFVSSQPASAWIHEDGVPLEHANARLPNPRIPYFNQNTNEYLTADLTVTSVGKITGYRLASLTSTLTEAQIENCDVIFHHAPNLDSRTPVLSYDTGTGTINLTDQTEDYESNANKDRFSLINCLPRMRQGGWGYTISGSDVTLYLWPNDVLNLTSGITYAARGRCIDFGSASHIHITGLIAEGAAGYGASTNSDYAVVKSTSTKSSNVVIRNCAVYRTCRVIDGYAPIYMPNVDDLVVESCLIHTAADQFGIFVAGGAGLVQGENALIRFVDVVDAEGSPFRIYTQKKAAFTNCRSRRSGLKVHSNKFNFYEQCHEVLAHNIDVDSARGYATWQEASRVHLVGCIIPAGFSDGRGIVDQNNSTDTPAIGLGEDGESSILNCWSWPNTLTIADERSLQLTSGSNTEVRYRVYNSVFHGAFLGSGSLSEIIAFSENVLTGGVALGAGSNQLITTAAANYEDPTAGDFRLKAGAPARTAVTRSLTSEIDALKTMFPQVPTADWDYDLVGNLIDWSDPHMGAMVNPDTSRRMVPVVLTPPTLSGVPIVGEALTSTAGIWSSSPYRSIAYQWLKDGANIPGETAATYTPVTGDIGATLGCQVTASNSEGSESTIVTASSAVVAEYALANPVVLTSLAASPGSSAVRQVETATFTASGKPLIVLFHFRHATSADTTATVTVGTPGRGFGTGTATSFLGRQRRTTFQTLIHTVLNPGTGSVTVQCEAVDTISAHRIEVIEIDRASTFALGTPTSTVNVLSRTPVKTTGATSTSLIYTLLRNAGDLSETNVVSGATSLLDGTTGGTGSSDFRTVVAWERVPVSGTVESATISWASIASAVGVAIEVRPVAAAAPVNTVAPVLSGTETVTQTLTATQGTWTGTPTPTYAYQWQTSPNGTTGWSDIGGATSTTYALTAGEAGEYIRCRVRASNTGGTVDAFTNVTGAISAGLSAFDIVHVDSAVDLVDASTYTFSGMDAGAAASGSDVVYTIVTVSTYSSAVRSVTGVTCAGAAMTSVVGTTTLTSCSAIFVIAQQSDLTPDIVVTLNGSTFGCQINVYRMVNPGSMTATDTASAVVNGSTALTLDLDIPTDGIAVGTMATRASGATTLVWSGLTAIGSPVDLGSFDLCQDAIGGTPGTPTAVSTANTGTFQSQAAAVASWGP